MLAPKRSSAAVSAAVSAGAYRSCSAAERTPCRYDVDGRLLDTCARRRVSSGTAALSGKALHALNTTCLQHAIVPCYTPMQVMPRRAPMKSAPSAQQGRGDHLAAEEVGQALHGCGEVAAPAAPPRSLPASTGASRPYLVRGLQTILQSVTNASHC